MTAVSAGHTVLAPSSELAAIVVDALERSYRAAGMTVWPTPQVRDLGSWQRERYAQRQLSDGGLPRCLTDLEERELWRDVVAASESRPDALDTGVAARLARRARRTVLEFGIPWGALAAHASEETESLLRWNRRFDERCRALDCIAGDQLTLRADLPGRPGETQTPRTPAESRHPGTSGTPGEPGEPIWWLDSPAWRPVARAWLQRHGRRVPPQEVASSRVACVHAGSPGAELAAAADWAERQLASEHEFRGWVCVPDLSRRRAEVTDAFDAAVAPHRFDLATQGGNARYAVSGGIPLTEYAPVAAALECLAAHGSALSFSRFSALLRSPYLQASEQDQSAADALDAAVRKRAPSEGNLRFWLDLADATADGTGLELPSSATRLRALGAVLAEARGARPISAWLPLWTAALQQGPWAQPARWSSAEYQAVQRLRELFASLACADSLLGSLAPESAQQTLRRAARETAFQPQTGVPPIWVSGQIIDPWLVYDGIWVTGMSAEHWPPPVEIVALLPASLQRSYGVISASAEAQVAHAEALQARWCRRARQIVLSRADGADGRRSSPSPLVPHAAVALYPAGAAPAGRPHWRAQRSVAPPLERRSDELAPPFGRAERTRGVATLRAQSLCAFRAFAETRLRTERLELPTPGFNARERGELVHAALEHVWSVLRDSAALHALPPAAERSLLDAGARRALRAACAQRDPGAAWRRRERLRLQGVLAEWLNAERRRLPFVVESLEHGAPPLRIAAMDFRVRIDRSDRLIDGGRVLIDYKTGTKSADWRGPRPANPQLPIYAMLSPHALTAVAYGCVNAVKPNFVCESERAGVFRPGARATPLEEAGSLAKLVEIWTARIETLAAEFARGQAAVAPAPGACRNCRLEGLCRVPGALQDTEPA